jgi:hypothetical protein
MQHAKGKMQKVAICRVFCILPFAFILAGCSSAPQDTEGPIRATQAYVAALEARDASALIQLLEPTDWREEIGPELRSYLGLVDTLALSDETYEVVEQRDDTATVRVAGTFAYTFADGGASGERPVDLLVETVRVDGQWYLRGLTLPQPGS